MLKLEAPWHTYQKMVKALFERDPDIIVGDIYQWDNGKDYGFDVEVRNHEKYLALDRVLNRMKIFGNIALYITLFDEENDLGDEAVNVYRTVFKGNPIVDDVKDIVDQAGAHHGFVVFKPEIIQFFDDDLTDYCGNWSGLAQYIAREVFDDVAHGVFFCTKNIRMPEAGGDEAEEPVEPLE